MASATSSRSPEPEEGPGRGRAEPPPRRVWRRRSLLFSPITRRLLAVNLIAPLMLGGGLLYLDQVRETLIQAELDGLRRQAELIAAALGEGAILTRPESLVAAPEEGPTPEVLDAGLHVLSPDAARKMVRRLSGLLSVRVRLFDIEGWLIADSRALRAFRGTVEVIDLPPPSDPPGPMARVVTALEAVGESLDDDDTLPLYREGVGQRATDYEEVQRSLETGVPGTMSRRHPRRGRMFTAAVPVQHYKQVVGAVLLSKDSRELEANLFEVRLDILRVFIGTLAVTILLSLYMAGTIARPLRRLALAAERVRHGQGQRRPLPDIGGRGDEIGELSDALREMTEALWARMDAIERFAADVAHELKNPLTSLRSAVETVSRIQDQEQQRKLLAIIVEDVQRLNRLISDISDASRLDAELSRAELETVDLGRMLEMLVELERASAGEDGPRHELNLPSSAIPPLVTGMEGRLVQVFRNILANAVSFSPPGGLIATTVRMREDRVETSITDEGPGIPEGKEAAIFERFYSERPEGEKFGTHSGLGLAISKQIVEALGGTIRAENRAERSGARFTVTLPLARQR